MNGELERLWKEAVMAYFKILFWDLPAGTEENHKKPQDYWPLGQDLTSGPLEYSRSANLSTTKFDKHKGHSLQFTKLHNNKV
jgi:hypothetical protein